MKFIDKSFKITETGYIEAVLSYEDYSKIADRIASSRIISSTRYMAILEDFEEELEIIIPNWIYKLRDEISITIDPLTKKSNEYLKELTGDKLITELSCIDRSVSLWVETLQECERNYKSLIFEDELSSLDVKNILPLCTAVHFILHINSDYFIENIWKILI